MAFFFARRFGKTNTSVRDGRPFGEPWAELGYSSQSQDPHD